MNIPLNIDWQQILLHLFNFVILAGGLYFLLYKPVKQFMEKRTAYFKQQEEDAKAKTAHAEELEAEYQKRLDQAEEEISLKKAEAAKEAEKMTQMHLDETRKQQDKMIAEARETAEQAKKKAVQESREEIVELAVQMADKLIHGEEVSHE